MSDDYDQDVSFMLPPWAIQKLMSSRSAHPQQNVVPARVGLAYKTLCQLLRLTENYAVPHPMGCEVVEGRELKTNEVNLMSTMCSVLQDYVLGHIEADQWEEQALSDREDRRVKGLVHPCYRCDGAGHSNCPTCRGSGQVEIRAVPLEEAR